MEGSWFSRVGGRKNFNGWLALAAITGMAFPLEASFEAYGTMVLFALGITSGLTVAEDAVGKRKAGG